MSIYSEFRPRYLYIKQHTITGLLYFGQTSQKDPLKYLGSGKYWLNHINKHGRDHVVTLWHELFTTETELTSFAAEFSKSLNIAKSDSWANLKDETGIDGGAYYGLVHTTEAKNKLRIAHTGRKHTAVQVEKWRKSVTGRTRSDETKLLMSMQRKGVPQAIVACPHCNKTGGHANMKRHHFNNCKYYSLESVSLE